MQMPMVTNAEKGALLEIQGRLMLSYKMGKTEIGPFSPSRVLRVTPGLKSAIGKGFAEGVEHDAKGKPAHYKVTELGIAVVFGVDASNPDFERVWREQALSDNKGSEGGGVGRHGGY